MEVAIRQTTVCSCIPTAIDKSIANRWTWHYRVLNRAFERLERPTGKLVRAVLRGLGGSNPSRLPDWQESVSASLLSSTFFDTSCRSREQDMKAFLGKVPVVGQHLGEPLLTHHLHGGTIGEAIVLI